MTPVASSFLKSAEGKAVASYSGLLDCMKHVMNEGTEEQKRTYRELVQHYAEGLDGIRAFMKSMETK